MADKIAKTTKPLLHRVVRRARLFRKLGTMLRKHRIVWVSAPAGSGKTTLAASWLDASEVGCLWYRLDSRDVDPATFFYYVAERVRQLTPRRREPLPLLTPEYALGLDAYARTFFEHVGKRLRGRTFIVLDDFQELPLHAPLQQILPAAINSLPEGFSVVALSREPPSPTFTRFLAEGRLSIIDASELNLTRAETLALLRARGVRSSTTESASALHAITGGWLAGTVLLLETKVDPPRQMFGNEACGRQVVFDYFAAEVLDRASVSTRRFLLETAFLPQVSPASATALTGENRSADILLDLQRRNYFTFRLAGTESQYQYHPLFRDFLTSVARRTIAAGQLQELLKRAAKVVLDEGSAEDAVGLLVEQGDEAALPGLIAELAPGLIRQGRLELLAEWIGALPADALNRNPWLVYFLGVARSVTSPEEARAHFERAYQSFEAVDTTEGMLLAWAGCVDTFVYVWDAFAPLDRWISAMDRLRSRGLDFPSADVEGRVVFGMLASLMWRKPEHVDTDYWLRRATTLIHADIDVELRMHLATYLLFHCIWWSGDHVRAEVLLAQMRPLLDKPDLTPLTQLLWFVMEAAYEARMGHSAECFSAVERGLELAEKTGILILNQQLAIQGVYAGLAAYDLPAAEAYHRRTQGYLRPSERLNFGHYLQLGAWISICSGDFVCARESILGAIELVHASGAALSQSWVDLTLAHACIEVNAFADAVPLLERALAWGRKTGNPLIEHHCLLSLALACTRQGREIDALKWLRNGLQMGREGQYVVHPWIGWRRGAMSELAALALEHEIETPYVENLIRIRGLKPPRSATTVSAWPGAIRIYTLGRFEIWSGERRMSFGHKTPRRQLEFLQALVALGDTEVTDARLSDELWPEIEGHNAHHALESAIYRLRTLLGSKRAIVHRDGKLSLDPECCWTDVHAMQVLFARGKSALKYGSAAAQDVRYYTERILGLYQGEFLPDATEDRAGVTEMRTRLRSKLSRYLRAVESQLGSATDRYLERAREADPELP